LNTIWKLVKAVKGGRPWKGKAVRIMPPGSGLLNDWRKIIIGFDCVGQDDV
jgi:hypothetical protein